MAALPNHISTRDLAALLRITERAVRLRADRGQWPRVYMRGQGGHSYHYLTAGLSAEIRATMLKHIDTAPSHPAANAGRACALNLHRQITEADKANRQAKEAGLAAFNLLPPARKQQALAREQILKARDAFIIAADLPKKQGSKLFVREYGAGTLDLPEWVIKAAGSRKGTPTLSWPTLHRWEKAYAEEGLAGLAGGYKPGRKTALPDHMSKFIEAMLVKFPHATIPHITNGLKARFAGQAMPSSAAVRRFVKTWKQKNANLYLYLTNPDAWKNKHLAAFGKADEIITRLNQLWEFDSTPGDIMLTDGRHTLIGVIDVYSRRAKIHVSPTSKSAAVAALTRKALLDWGVPETAKTDNGADYVSEHLVRVFESLEIHQHLCTAFSPEEKPHIERFFGTLARDLVELLPGYIGHSVAERKAIEARRSFAQRLMRCGDDPVEINMTADQLQQILDRWCHAVYHQNPHNSLGGKTPAQTAREWTAPIRRISDPRTLDILLSPAPDNHGLRTIQKKGVKIDNAWFVAPELAPLIGEQVFVLLDATDYGTIYVFTLESDDSRTYLCTAVNPERTGHDRAQIAARAKAVQKQFISEGSKQLKKAARQAAVAAIGTEILEYREHQIANIREFPKPDEEHLTDDMGQAARVVDDLHRKALGPQPIEITAEQEASASRLIDMNQARMNSRPLPATAQEKYEQLCDDLRAGMDVSDADLAFMKRHELWLETGERATY
jgi:transposase InsO family protein